ncbi:hypothetical protein KUV51_21260 [Tateyamaria omphalii]|uniref:hypothetical protein n=1 Tax=Tateyamaria omphalii TaxID=299262 RepID=UPI001C994732|nr:hypothetical protein [Tateyamaria omphalii]MBY5935551.1 hypothetical protein [Tateyamaria omphalii]
MKTLYLHIGLQKTGTSTVQMHFMHPKGPFQAAGIDCLPQAIAPNQAHHNAAWDVGKHKRFRPDLPGFSDLVDAARASTSDRIFVSSEDFSLISAAQVREVAAGLSDFDVRPILCLRNQLTWSESIFAQACKRGYVKPFGTFVKTLSKNGRTNFEGIYSAWADVFGHDKMHVLIYEDHADISDAFAALMGVEVEARPARKNQSLNERFVKASQTVTQRCMDGELTYNGQTLPPEALNDVSKVMLAVGTHHPQFTGSPVFLKRDKAQTYLDRFGDMNAKIAKHVALPDSYFTVPESRRNPRKYYELDVDFLVECIFESEATEKLRTDIRAGYA